MARVSGMVGLEIHVYLISREKLFCSCIASRERGLKPNSYICPICTGQPGAKPLAPSASIVEKALSIALLLGCSIQSPLQWMRKHYSWPDNPKGYQTTMSGEHATPLGLSGKFKGISISSMHLEEDPAAWDPQTGCVDYNRSGLPLVEIVTAPDFTSAEQVTEWIEALTRALSYLKCVDSNAGLKIDVNVNYPGKTERVEIKNISSIESVKRAIEFEFERQLREGSIRETRRFDDSTGKTITMRSKEQKEDYRFILDPDLPVVVIPSEMIDRVSTQLPELPEVKLARLIKDYRISKQEAAVLTQHLDIASFFEQVVHAIEPSFAVPWVTGELLRVLNWNKTSLDKVEIKPEHFIELLKLVKSGKITGLQAKQMLNQFIPRSFMPYVDAGKIDSEKELEPFVRTVLEKQKKAVADYKAGDSKSLNFLLGEIMKATQRRADFKLAKKLLEKYLT
jgi:aspartyl-tRNA(Asn)/glutamyl-tRNA(Gln) amidotransferase subunit B